MTITIRALRAADHDAWIPLWRGYQAFYEADIAPEVSAVTWKRLLDPTEPMAGALAWADDASVGLVHTIRHRSCWTIGDYCYLQDLFVADRQRGRGIGRQLIEYAGETAREAGCSRIHWLTHETNLDAMKLYDRVADRSGFIQYRKLFVPFYEKERRDIRPSLRAATDRSFLMKHGRHSSVQSFDLKRLLQNDGARDRI